MHVAPWMLNAQLWALSRDQSPCTVLLELSVNVRKPRCIQRRQAASDLLRSQRPDLRVKSVACERAGERAWAPLTLDTPCVPRSPVVPACATQPQRRGAHSLACAGPQIVTCAAQRRFFDLPWGSIYDAPSVRQQSFTCAQTHPVRRSPLRLAQRCKS